jgi:hypothetical protein
MNLSDNHKQWAAWTITVLLTLAIALFFGVQYPLPEQPEETVEPVPLAAHFSNPVDIEGSASAASPALTFQGDTDTGIWRSASDTFNITTGGTERLELDASSLDIVPPISLSGAATFGAATTINNNLTVTGTADLQGNVSDTGGTFTFVDDLMLDGQADANQLTIQGYTTQTNSLQVWEQSDGTDVATMSNDGLLEIDGGLDLSSNDITELANLRFDANSSDGAMLQLQMQSISISEGGQEIDPWSSFAKISCNSAYTFTIADHDSGDDGEILVLISDGTDTCTLDESEGNHITGGDLALGGAENDAAVLMWLDIPLGTKAWVALATKLDN